MSETTEKLSPLGTRGMATPTAEESDPYGAQIATGERPTKVESGGDHGRARGVIPRYLAERPLAVAVGSNLLLFLLSYLIWTPKFLFNDDPMKMLLVAGVGRVAEPSMYINYTNVVIGWVLKQLYSIPIDLPWYALYLIFGLFAAQTTYLYLILKRAPRVAAVLLYSAYFCLVVVNLLINLQFTITSTLISIAGFLLLIDGGRAVGDSVGLRLRHLLSPTTGAGLALVVLGSLIRPDGMELAGLLVAPFLLLLLRPGRYKAIVSPAILWMVGLALCFGFAIVHRTFYSANPDSKDFLEANHLSEQFRDYNAESRVDREMMVSVIRENDWSMNDFLMFKSWFSMDDKIYNAESYGAMLSALPNRNVQQTSADVFAEFGKIMDDDFVRTCIVGLLLMLVFLSMDVRTGALIGGLLLLVSALIAYLILFKKPPPDRVYFAMFSFVALAPLLRLRSDRIVSFSNTGLFRRGFGILVLVTSVAYGVSAGKSYQLQSSYNSQDQRWYRETIENLNPNEDQLYIAWTGAAAWQMLAPFGGLEFLAGFIAPDSRLYPSTKTVLRHFGVDDAHTALAIVDDVFLVVHTRNAKVKLPMYQQYMLEHYSLEVDWRWVAGNQMFEVYDIFVPDADSEKIGGSQQEQD